MPVRFQHNQNSNSHYFITFTCYKWISLFEKSGAYDAVYKFFDYLHTKNVSVTGYVIMPNHVHLLLYFPEMPTSLNTIVGNGKRFMAYEIIKRLEAKNELLLLEQLHGAVKKREGKKGQVHKVFEESFDAKECCSHEFLIQKLDYIHKNPVSKKWQLVKEFTDYEYSSASFYAGGEKKYDKLVPINDLLQ